VACENTLIERKIPKENIIPLAGFVKMAVAEIILKQEQGWSYIKAGF
jgi:intracellular sulfur oxidation DsrE/DsrF family protein